MCPASSMTPPVPAVEAKGRARVCQAGVFLSRAVSAAVMEMAIVAVAADAVVAVAADAAAGVEEAVAAQAVVLAAELWEAGEQGAASRPRGHRWCLAMSMAG